VKRVTIKSKLNNTQFLILVMKLIIYCAVHKVLKQIFIIALESHPTGTFGE